MLKHPKHLSHTMHRRTQTHRFLRSQKTNHPNHIQRLARLHNTVLQQLKGLGCLNHTLHQTLCNTLMHLNLNQGQVRVDTKQELVLADSKHQEQYQWVTSDTWSCVDANHPAQSHSGKGAATYTSHKVRIME